MTNKMEELLVPIRDRDDLVLPGEYVKITAVIGDLSSVEIAEIEIRDGIAILYIQLEERDYEILGNGHNKIHGHDQDETVVLFSGTNSREEHSSFEISIEGLYDAFLKTNRSYFEVAFIKQKTPEEDEGYGIEIE